MQCSYYEMLFLAALLIFIEAGCHFCIIESAMGGVLDATNIMDRTECPLMDDGRCQCMHWADLFCNRVVLEEDSVRKGKILSKNSSKESSKSIETESDEHCKSDSESEKVFNTIRKFTNNQESLALPIEKEGFRTSALAVGITTVTLDHPHHLGSNISLILDNLMALRRVGVPIILQESGGAVYAPREVPRLAVKKYSQTLLSRSVLTGLKLSNNENLSHNNLLLRINPYWHGNNVDMALALYVTIAKGLEEKFNIICPRAPPHNIISHLAEVEGRPSRFQINEKEIVIDAAQNGASPLFRQKELVAAGPTTRIHLVFGLNGAKGISQHSNLLTALGCNPNYRFTFVDLQSQTNFPSVHPVDPSLMTKCVLSHCHNLSVEPNITHYRTFEEVISDPVKNETIIIFGSPYIVSDFLSQYDPLIEDGDYCLMQSTLKL